MLRRLLPALVLLSPACASFGEPEEPVGPLSPTALAQEAGVELTTPPFDDVHTQWKERLAQPYVYFEHRGPRETFGSTMRALLEFAVHRRVETSGQPFGLFAEGMAPRACLPVEINPGENGLPFGVLPAGMVAYAVVSGPYPDAPRALPGLSEDMSAQGWKARGPVREIYLVNPAEVSTYSDLATEIQVPWSELP